MPDRKRSAILQQRKRHYAFVTDSGDVIGGSFWELSMEDGTNARKKKTAAESN